MTILVGSYYYVDGTGTNESYGKVLQLGWRPTFAVHTILFGAQPRYQGDKLFSHIEKHSIQSVYIIESAKQNHVGFPLDLGTDRIMNFLGFLWIWRLNCIMNLLCPSGLETDSITNLFALFPLESEMHLL